MPVLAPAELSQILHETNARLRFWLDSLIPEAKALSVSLPAAGPTALSRTPAPPQLAGLLSELMRAGQCLRTLSGEKDAELDRELSEYRSSVERLRALLPSIHSTLLEERARLEQERARVRSAAAWASRSRQTL